MAARSSKRSSRDSAPKRKAAASKSKPKTVRDLTATFAVAPAQRMIRARLDTAANTNRNKNHWINADKLSADKLMSAPVRAKLRERARYEYHNNCYAQGMVRSLAADVVGTGPRLNIAIESEEIAEDAKRLERLWLDWADEINLADKLMEMRAARSHTGEAFALLVTNDANPGRIKLDIRLVEADRISHSVSIDDIDRIVDGIEYDEQGNPTVYKMLKTHPGDLRYPVEIVDVPAALMLHYFCPNRPEQSRGIPELTPALNLFAQLRRYTEAVLDAAETAARISGTIEMPANPDEPEDYSGSSFDEIDLPSNAGLALPPGWKFNQVKPEQPTTTYSQFKSEILKEAARSLGIPWNVAAGDSSGYNYSSGRLDHQTYHRRIAIDRDHMARTVLDRIFAEWLLEASKIEGLIPQRFRTNDVPRYSWRWDGFVHVDPSKEANAAATLLSIGATTLEEIWAAKGGDWRTAVAQMGVERQELERHGVAVADSGQPSAQPDDEAAGEEA